MVFHGKHAEMTGQNITIIGAGIAGLATALALGRAGHEVVVHEQAAEFSNIGAGLQLGPNAIRALKAIDAWDAVAPLTTSPAAIEMRDGPTGTLLRELPLGEAFEQRFGEPYRVIHRADLQAALLACVQTLVSIQIKMGSQAEAESACTIAADGVHSPTRRKLFSQSATAHDTTFFRAMSPVVSNRVQLMLFPKAHVVAYAVGKPEVMNIVVAVDGVTTTEQGWATAPQRDVLKHLQHNIALPEFLTAAKSWTSWQAFSAPQLVDWHNDHICLIGDAAHGCLPYLAQGAAMALEDAVAIRQAFQGRNARDAFLVFQQQRKTRTEKIARMSAQQGRTYHASGLMRLARNQVLRHLPDALLMQRLNWIYRYGE